jgi:hypothetical protein
MEELLIFTGCTERVASRKLPHASDKLAYSAAEDCHANGDIWSGNLQRMHVVKGEDKRRRCEGEQASTVTHGS